MFILEREKKERKRKRKKNRKVGKKPDKSFFKQYVYSVCFSSKMVTLDVFYRIRSISSVLKFDTLL
jgi:hypothetical protein